MAPSSSVFNLLALYSASPFYACACGPFLPPSLPPGPILVDVLNPSLPCAGAVAVAVAVVL